jgi:hypothetical protein
MSPAPSDLASIWAGSLADLVSAASDPVVFQLGNRFDFSDRAPDEFWGYPG